MPYVWFAITKLNTEKQKKEKKLQNTSDIDEAHVKSQLRKSIHIQLCRQRATVYMKGGTVCKWSHEGC